MYQNLLKEVVIIDDEPVTTQMLVDFVKSKYPGITVTTYNTGEEALGEMTDTVSLVILDYHLDSTTPASMNGLQILKKLGEKFDNRIPVVMHTGQDDVETAANIIKYGAYDYVVKGTHAFARLEIVMNNILKNEGLRKNLVSQRVMNYILMGLLLALAVGFVLSKMI